MKLGHWIVIAMGAILLFYILAALKMEAAADPSGRENNLKERTVRTFDPEYGVACYYFNGRMSCVQVTEGNANSVSKENQ